MTSQSAFLFWSLKDLVVLIVSLIVSVLVLITFKTYIFLALSLLLAFLSVRTEEKSFLEYIRLAVRYIFFTQKTYIFSFKEKKQNEKEKHN